jgi:hypothetical protein
MSPSVSISGPVAAGNTYRTTSLDLATFLKSQGHPLLGTDVSGTLVEFVFPSEARADVDVYYSGVAHVRPMHLFETFHDLRRRMLALRKRSGDVA